MRTRTVRLVADAPPSGQSCSGRISETGIPISSQPKPSREPVGRLVSELRGPLQITVQMRKSAPTPVLRYGWMTKLEEAGGEAGATSKASRLKLFESSICEALSAVLPTASSRTVVQLTVPPSIPRLS